MKNLDGVKRAVSLVIVLSVTALYAVGVYTLDKSQSAYRAIDTIHEQGDVYHDVSVLLQHEDDTINVFLTTHSAPEMKIFFKYSEEINAELAKRLDAPTDSADANALRTVRNMHDHYVASAARLLAAIEHHRMAEATAITRNELLPRDRRLNAFLIEHLETLDAIHDRIDGEAEAQQPRLRFTLVTIGMIAMVLLLTTNIYRRRADRALQKEMLRLEEAMLTDTLTGIGNRRAFHNDIVQQIARSGRHQRAFTLALIDIDHFKALNDVRGHAHGDDVLVTVSQILQRLRAGDTPYRISGNEFALLLTEANSDEASIVLQRLQTLVRQSIAGVTLSIGYAEGREHASDHDLRERASSALYEAKRRGRNTTVDFETIRDTVNVISSQKTAAFQRLLSEDDALTAAFQPIWAIDGTGIVAFEALSRPNPSLRFAGPQEAFDLAERLHRVVDLDLLCLRKALSLAQRLPPGVSLFVNVTPETLVHPAFDPVSWVADVRAAGLEPAQLVVEVTERSIIYPEILVARVKKLKTLGVRVALDDTGAGYAGLEVLSSIAFDFVKIDRGLMLKAIADRSARGVLRGIISIAEETGAFLIAEGIETIEQLGFITHVHDSNHVGVRAVQGYFLGEPQTGPLNPPLFAHYRQRLSGPEAIAG